MRVYVRACALVLLTARAYGMSVKRGRYLTWPFHSGEVCHLYSGQTVVTEEKTRNMHARLFCLYMLHKTPQFTHVTKFGILCVFGFKRVRVRVSV